jgi:ubiquinone/menaquinone biosynthesis C-methylase UbiE
MAIGSWAAAAGGAMSRGMHRLNARHPWSHNDHFHSWVVARLPRPCAAVLDVGCGRGELLMELSSHAARVVGNDADAHMLDEAATRCAGLRNVSVVGGRWEEIAGPFDAVTMIAVLHHLDAERALSEVARLLAPGGKFLAVGLAKPQSAADYLWEAVCIATNPIVGYVKHPWPSDATIEPPPFPVRDPEMSLDELHEIVDRAMPGATVRRRLGFRHTIEWSKARV